MFILPPSPLKCSCYSNEVAGVSPTKHSLPPPFPAASKIVSSLGPVCFPFVPYSGIATYPPRLWYFAQMLFFSFLFLACCGLWDFCSPTRG